MPVIPSTVLRVLLLGEFISFCLSDVDDTLYNAALNRPVFASSELLNFLGKYNFYAYLANDGSIETDIYHGGEGQCFHSADYDHPWWAVDLGRPMAVVRADFTNRGDCCGSRSNNFIIGLTNISPNVSRPTLWNYTLCGQYPGTVPNGATVILYCNDNPQQFRYVIVQIPTTNFRLNFCELQVFVKNDTRHRLDNFVVGLTNNNPATTPPVDKSSYTVCAQYNGSVTPGEDSTVICAPASQKFRYVIIHGSPATDDGALCMADVSVFARSNNLVLNKPTYQISTDGDKVSSRATDGRPNTESCTRDVDEHPWWAVDLGDAYDVGRVLVYTGANANLAGNLDNFVVGLTNDDPTTTAPCFKCTYKICNESSDSVAARQKVAVDCVPSSEKFRFVIVQSSVNKAAAICLAEVDVYDRSDSMGENSTSTKTLGLAVDGLAASEACCYKADKNPWWAVDFGRAYDIGHVVVTAGYGQARAVVSRQRLESRAAERLHSLNGSLLIIIAMFSLCTGLLL